MSGRNLCKENTKNSVRPVPVLLNSDGSAHQQVACRTQKHIGHVNPLPARLGLLFSAYTPGSCFPLHSGTNVYSDFVINLKSLAFGNEQKSFYPPNFDIQHFLIVFLHAFTGFCPLSYLRVRFVESQLTLLYLPGTSKEATRYG